MKVSVVIPTYNEIAYIGRCIEALRRVGVNEIIVIDGASEDGTVDVARKAADVVLSSKEYNSPSRARNAGLRVAEGEIVAFIDGDTVVSTTWLEGLLDAFKDPNVVGASGPALPLEGNSGLIAPYILSYDLLVRATLALGRPQFLGFNSAYRKEVLEEIGGFREDVVVSEDALLSMMAYKIGHLVFTPKMLVYTSSRRVRVRGLVESIFYLLYNGLSVLIFEKPIKVYPKVSCPS